MAVAMTLLTAEQLAEIQARAGNCYDWWVRDAPDGVIYRTVATGPNSGRLDVIARGCSADNARLIAALPALLAHVRALEAAPAAIGDGWTSVDSKPPVGTPVDIYLGRGAMPHRIADVYWGRPDHVCDGQYCDSCPPDRDTWCHLYSRRALFDPAEDGSDGEAQPHDHHVTHWRPAVPDPVDPQGTAA